MICPKCKQNTTTVREKRNRGDIARRRRTCYNCGCSFFTREVYVPEGDRRENKAMKCCVCGKQSGDNGGIFFEAEYKDGTRGGVCMECIVKRFEQKFLYGSGKK